MKNILLCMSVILILASCQQKAGITNVRGQSQMPIVPVYNNSAFSDTASIEEAFYKPIKYERIKQVRSKKIVRKPLPQEVITETAAVPPVEVEPVQTPPVVTAPAATPAGVGTSPSVAGVDKADGTGTIETIPQPEKKKGWSSAAKGTVIGAGAGAIGGAILSKKKGKGAIIGGIIGAAGGYVIGKGMDKKDNRLADN